MLVAMATRRPKHRKHDRVTLASHKSVIPAYGGKPFVGRDTVLTVSHLTGTGSTRNPWHVVVTDGEHFWHLEPDDVVRAEGDAGAHSIKKRPKSPAQLDREIASVLTRPRPRKHHATRRDEWDVAMDAILEHDPERAAHIVRKIREEHGFTTATPPEFSDAMRAVTDDVRTRFFKLLDEQGKPKALYITVRLPRRAGFEVLAKETKYGPSAYTFANRTQADRKAAEVGNGFEVYQWGRPWFVARQS